MRIERLYLHRLIRLLQVVLPVVVLALVAIPAWNYWVRLKQGHRESPKPLELPKDLAIRTDNFSFSRTDGGRTLFTIRAKTNLGFIDNRNMLQDVDITIYSDQESVPPRMVKSRECNYEQATDNIRCSGAVEIQLDEQTRVRTEELVYGHAERRIHSTKPVEFERQGAAAGSANTLEYLMTSGLLNLNGSVKLRNRAIDLETASVVFDENQNWASASGGVFLKGANGWIRGDRAKADLSPGTYEPRVIVIEEGVTSESRSVDGRSTWKLRAGWMQARLSDLGIAEKVLARTNVELQQTTEKGSLLLNGGEVEANLTSSGTVEFIEARNAAQMTFSPDRFLRSSRIFSTVSGRVETPDESELRVGDYLVQGRGFEIQSGDLVTFHTESRATLKSNARETSADTTDATFDSRTNQLIGLVQKGNFVFKDGSRSGNSNSAKLEDNGAIVTLEGSAKVRESGRQIEARLITINDKNRSVRAAGNVRTISRESGEQVLVMADQVDNVGEQITYSGKVRLFRGDATIETDLLKVRGTAGTLQLEALGNVFSTLNNIRVWAGKLDYNEQTKLATYSEGVRAQSKDMNLRSSAMTVKAEEKQNAVSEIIARGNALVTRGTFRGSGEQAIYNSARQQVLLTGSNAEVSDGQGNITRGPRITLNVAGARMAVVESTEDERAVTKYKVPRNKQ